MNEEILKALSLIAAELHIQNHMNILAFQNIKPGLSMMSEIMIPELADHFKNYFKGEVFSPGFVTKFEIHIGR